MIINKIYNKLKEKDRYNIDCSLIVGLCLGLLWLPLGLFIGLIGLDILAWVLVDC